MDFLFADNDSTRPASAVGDASTSARSASESGRATPPLGGGKRTTSEISPSECHAAPSCFESTLTTLLSASQPVAKKEKRAQGPPPLGMRRKADAY